MSLRIKQVVDRFLKELQEAIDAEIQDRMVKERADLHQKLQSVLEIPSWVPTSQNGEQAFDELPSITIAVTAVTDEYVDKVYFKIRHSTRLKRLMEKYCSQKSKELGSVKFFFGGHRIRGDETPEEVS
ncbi:hypothetical protein F0562_019694 [Nyssa sinensis]|uniref:Rad60/SUMO-like domain-containing protein n=1 Tax=Nyssa sinensis TaxID=561372 RepID=A0A5J5BUF9_9ASTE|nr:hypothetical protein F0562_019694 [Nyssa sinensis]